jgi:beta-lactamase regulating signal transducer with metallopeptidase domain
MHPQAYLQFTDAFLTFWLRMAVACVFCSCLARLLRQPRHRFLVWLAFLAGSGLYWLAIILTAAVSVISKPLASAVPALHLARETPAHLLISSGSANLIARGDLLCELAYAVMLSIFVGRRLVKEIRLRVLLRLAAPASPELTERVNVLCSELRVKHCRVLLLPALISPGTVYWRNPCILLPEGCSEAPDAGLADVLRHELVHILRRDYLFSVISDAISALLFFHPGAWWARKRMRLERELACDQAVVKARPEHRADYADNLARFMRLRLIAAQQPSPGIDFADSASLLGTRIRSILAEPRKTPLWRSLSTAAAGLLFVICFARLAPALSVELDLMATSRRETATRLPLKVAHSTAPLPRAARHVPRTASSRSVPMGTESAQEYPDNLTTLRVHEPTVSDSTFAPADASGDDSSGIADSSLPLWAEGSSGTRRPSASSTVREVILATAGGIALGEHGEHSEHGSHSHKLSSH